MMERERLEILGCPIDVLTMDTAVEHISSAIANTGTCQVVTANAEILYAAQHDPELFVILQDAGLVTADGMGVILASRILGTPLAERVAGYDLLHALAARSERTGWKIYLLGAKQEVVDAAAANLRRMYPAITIAGKHHGYFAQEETGSVLHDIKQTGADILFVALGAPRAEKWIYANLNKSGASIGIGVGGSFDILAGVSVRAPLWMQRIGLEWLFRLWRQPSRIWRMLALPKFIWMVLWNKWVH